MNNKDLLQVVNNKAVVSAYAKTILEFKNLSLEDLAYVYFMTDYRSPYAVYDVEDRHEQVKNSIFTSKWNTNPKIEAACIKYAELTETSGIKLLKAAKGSVIKLEKYFNSIDLTLTDDNGKPIYAAKDLISNLEKMGKVVEGLTRLEDLVRKEVQADSNRGGVEVNKYSV